MQIKGTFFSDREMVAGIYLADKMVSFNILLRMWREIKDMERFVHLKLFIKII